MKTSRIYALIASAAVLLGVGGCVSFTKKDMLALFETGVHPLYVVVPGKSKKLTDIPEFQKNCGTFKIDDTKVPSYNSWMTTNICPDISKWQSTSGVYHTKVWGLHGVKFLVAYAPAEWNIEQDDILEVSVDASNEGGVARPNIVTRIARKAKDATKESGCWWDGGKGATTAFISGGAVCDGWNWRNQKFAKE